MRLGWAYISGAQHGRVCTRSNVESGNEFILVDPFVSVEIGVAWNLVYLSALETMSSACESRKELLLTGSPNENLPHIVEAVEYTVGL